MTNKELKSKDFYEARLALGPQAPRTHNIFKGEKEMMKHEFEARVGFRVTAEEYTDIETVYRNDPKNRDKNRFCREWLKDGGIQWVLDRRQGVINIQRERITGLEAENPDLYKQIGRQGEVHTETKKRLAELEKSLNQVRELVA